MNLATVCDLIVCSPLARFETRFPQMGLHPGGGHLWQLRQRIGRQGAAALALFGEVLSGEEAAHRGLAWRCMPESDLLAAAVECATRQRAWTVLWLNESAPRSMTAPQSTRRRTP
jgi:enoyl-CoA hydratase